MLGLGRRVERPAQGSIAATRTFLSRGYVIVIHKGPRMPDYPTEPVSNKSWFPDHYWARPKIAERPVGDLTDRRLYQAVGIALTDFEKSQESLAYLYSYLVGAKQGQGDQAAALRTFGAIEAAQPRIEAVRQVAQLYFAPYWHIPEIRTPFRLLLDDAKKAADRRNDIAHGKVVHIRQFVKGGRQVNLTSGYMLVAPSYMTGRTDPFPSEDEDDIFGITKSHYRFNTQDILSYSKKFSVLSNSLVHYAHGCFRDETYNIPRFIQKMKAADPVAFERKMRR